MTETIRKRKPEPERRETSDLSIRALYELLIADAGRTIIGSPLEVLAQVYEE